jgi:spore coat protein U-like protein
VKKTVFLLAGLFVMMLATQQMKAQNGTSASATGTAEAKATLIRPITISMETNLNFGTIVVPSSTTGGTVMVSTDGTTEVTGTDISLAESLGDPPTTASFTVTGEPNGTYAITLPDDNTVTISGPGEDMTVTGFTSNPDGTGVLAGGTQTLSVGATLNVGADQAAGEYAGEFTVTVAYN